MKKTTEDLRIETSSLVAGLMRHLSDEVEGFEELLTRKGVHRTVRLLSPEEEYSKIALALSFVQKDYENPRENLEEEVLAAIEEYLNMRSMRDYFDDVSVNLSSLPQDTEDHS